MKQCKDCEPGSKRPAPHPGPRCATHHRAFRKAQAARQRDNRREKVYGLTPTQFKALLAAQGGVCAICAKPMVKRPCIDHNHETGEVRGILHPSCNFDLIGRFGLMDLARAAQYLLDPPGPRVLNGHRVPIPGENLNGEDT